AYVAERRSELADVRAHDAVNVKRQELADNEYQRLTRIQTAEKHAMLGATGQQLQQAQEQRLAAEQRARDALNRLAITIHAALNQEPRGLVLTMPGQVLFATGKSSLLPPARRKLDLVAVALMGLPDDKILVEGHTDSTGTAELNQKLSEERAA